MTPTNFDNITPPALPSGWLSSGGGSAAWATRVGTRYPSGIAAHSASNLVYFNSYFISSGTTASLISPVFSITNTTGKISFWMYRDSGSSTKADLINVYVNTSASLSGACLLGTVNRSTTLSPAVSSPGWYQYSFDIPSTYSGATNYLLIDGVSGYGNDIHLDDIAIIQTWTVSATTDSNGTVSCTSPVENGATSSCIVTPASGYQLATFSDNNVDMKSSVTGGSYSVNSVTANHAIVATFSPIPYSADNGTCGSSTVRTLGHYSAAFCQQAYLWIDLPAQLTVRLQTQEAILSA